MPKAAELEPLIERALGNFIAFVNEKSWVGREREAVSLFAFGFLLKECRPGAVLQDPAQIGIEVAVPQLRGDGRKRVVCKDLVIWSEPRMTVWDRDGNPANYPIGILEWKCNHSEQVSGDIEWLKQFSLFSDDFVGFSIDLRLDQQERSMVVRKIVQGTALAFSI